MYRRGKKKEERLKMKEEGNEECLEFEKLGVWHRKIKKESIEISKILVGLIKYLSDKRGEQKEESFL